jgi:MFS family permease
MFKLRNIVTSNIVAVLWAAAMFAWFFMSALYLQLILKYSPMQVGLSFLPANVIMAAFSIGLSAKLVLKFGIKKPLVIGLSIASLGLFLFVFAPINGSFWVNVFPSMVLLGIGGGMAFNPMLLAAMKDVKPEDSGLASGLVNTSFMMGGALGLAILASLAVARTTSLHVTGNPVVAVNEGYHLAFLVGALFALMAALIGGVFLKVKNGPNEAVAVH